MTTLQMIPLNRLKHGSDPDAGVLINARVTNKTEGAQAIAASARAIMRKIPDHSGIVVPLAVAQGGDTGFYFVIAGGVRLAALHLLLKDKTIKPTHEVPAIVHGDAVTLNEIALEMSIIENAQRTPLHPIDEYEAYAVIETAHAEDGMSDADIITEIATSFAISERTVRQRLALGRSLSPAVRKAWRAGVVTAASAKVFTLAPDAKTQDRVLNTLRDGAGNAYAVKNALGLDTPADAQRFVQFVGADAYRAAGGTITEDLFGMNHQIDNPALAKQLADKKLLAMATTESSTPAWGWAAPAETVPGWQGWPRLYGKPKATAEQQAEIDRLDAVLVAGPDEAIEAAALTLADLHTVIELAGFTAKQKKESGCVFYIGNDGDLKVVMGVQKPVEKKLTGKNSDQIIIDDPHAPAPAKEPSGPPQSLISALNVVLTRAAASAIGADPALAVAGLLAAVVADMGPQPVRVTTSGIAGRADTYPRQLRDGSPHFEKLLKRYHGMAAKQRADLLTAMVADALNLTAGLTDEAVAAFASMLPAKAMNAELHRLFDRKAYFEAVSNAVRASIVAETVSQDAAYRVEKMNKANAVKFCLAEIDKKWLPPQLRTRHYDGPKRKGK